MSDFAPDALAQAVPAALAAGQAREAGEARKIEPIRLGARTIDFHGFAEGPPDRIARARRFAADAGPMIKCRQHRGNAAGPGQESMNA